MKQLRQEPDLLSVVDATVRSPTLHDMLRVGGAVDWRAVADRIKSHGYEAAVAAMNGWFGGRSRYPLQLALTRPSDPAPPEIIRALIDAHPGAVFTTDEIGNTPLYYECIHGGGSASHDDSHGSVVRMLLDANPAAASQPERYYVKIPLHVARDERTARLLLDVYPQGIGVKCHLGQLPLHRACLNRDATSGLCRLLVEEGRLAGLGGEDGLGGVAVRDMSGKTPLDYVCDKIIHASDLCSSDDGGGVVGSGSTSPLPSPGTSLGRLLDKLSTLACGALPPQHCRDDSNSLLLVHAVIELGCPLELVGIALRRLGSHPCNLVRERDCLGRTPLAVAASSADTSPVVVDLLLNSERVSGGGGASVVTGSVASVASVPDLGGRLPLHLAAGSGRGFDGAMRTILRAEPLALLTRDSDGLFPFMTAAVAKDGSVDTVWNLLREAPSVVSDCL